MVHLNIDAFQDKIIYLNSTTILHIVHIWCQTLIRITLSCIQLWKKTYFPCQWPPTALTSTNLRNLLNFLGKISCVTSTRTFDAHWYAFFAHRSEYFKKCNASLLYSSSSFVSCIVSLDNHCYHYYYFIIIIIIINMIIVNVIVI